jgi:glycosyltransferase involved in cell wall biosynthesis
MPMPPTPATTVVIPCYNGEAYLAEAIASARANATGPLEVIVVDDGSTDGSAAIARSAATRYVRQDNAGVAAALNHGVRLATTGYISFLSADDLWRPGKLALQHAALAGTAGRLVFGHMLHFASPELTPETAAALVVPPDPMPAYSAGTMLARLATVRGLGPFNESFSVGEFMDWFGRARDSGAEIVMLPDTVSLRRVHKSNHSTRMLKSRSYAPVLKALLDRRRAAGERP